MRDTRTPGYSLNLTEDIKVSSPQSGKPEPTLSLTREVLSPPKNSYSEYAFLGALLINGKRVLNDCEEVLKPDYFFYDTNRHIYSVALDMHAKGLVIDLITIRARLDPEMFPEKKISEYLAPLCVSMVSITTARQYAREIRDTWLRRELFFLCERTSLEAQAPKGLPGEDLMEGIESELLSLAQGFSESAPTITVGEAVQNALQGAEDALNNGDGLAGLSWGYANLDRMTGGLMPEGLYIIGARPAMGKTALALGIAMRSAAISGRVLFWSGEMSAKQLGARISAAGAQISARSVFTGRRYDVPPDMQSGKDQPLAQHQWDDLIQVQLEAGKVPLEFDDRPGLKVASLRSRARRMVRSKEGLKAIVLDYIGLMQGSDTARRQGKYAEMTEISQELKALAKELRIPIIVMAQLNREVEKRDDKRPTEADLRDSGGLEQDADVVAFLYRDHYYLKREFEGDGVKRRSGENAEAFAVRVEGLREKLQKSEGKAQLFIRKNRHGGTGTAHFKFDGDSTWFRDESEDERSPAWTIAKDGP